MRGIVVLGGAVCLLAASAMAQDPVKVDPKHYKVELENAQVRVLHVQYGPHEKSVMHSHPASVIISMTDQDAKFTLPRGKTIERHMKAGEIGWAPAETHLPENMNDKPLDVILVEMKGGKGGAHRPRK
jgi:quercetin dioxygenase-like cupin family protein